MAIHGDKSQQERDYVLNGIFYSLFFFLCQFFCQLVLLIVLLCYCTLFTEFRNGKINILVATDVAARGLGKTIANALWFAVSSVYILLAPSRTCEETRSFEWLTHIDFEVSHSTFRLTLVPVLSPDLPAVFGIGCSLKRVEPNFCTVFFAFCSK